MTEQPKAGAHIHLIGICGVGMASLAGLLHSQGYRVTGSDENVYPPMSLYLERLGIPVSMGYRAEHVDDGPDLVVVGNVVSRGNLEAQAVLGRGLPYVSLPDALSEFLIDGKRSIVVAGTHGKTTTTSLAAWVWAKAGLDPSLFVGGLPANFDSGFRHTTGSWVVVEGDEYDTAFFDKGPKFLHYKPQTVILTSIEFDHADIYRDLEHLKSAFRGLMDLIPRSGRLVVCNEYPAAKEVAGAARCPVIFYGQGEPQGWEAGDLVVRERCTRFEARYRGKAEEILEVQMWGRHNVSNALAVYALARELGIDRSLLREGLATFLGVRRRQEWKGVVGGVTLIDDFAHHPTAVRETVAGVRSAYPGSRLWAIFEPRSHTSRRKIFEREFACALAEADRVVVAGLYQPDKIPAEDRLSPAAVVAEVNRLRGDRRAVFMERAAEIAAHVGETAQAGDVILVMSNGGFDGIQEKILAALKQKNPAGGGNGID